MIAKNQAIFGYGKLRLDEKEDQATQAVLTCLSLNLPKFVKKYKLKNIETKNEDGITQHLCRFLNRNIGNFPFLFDKEDIEDTTKGNSAKVDIGVYPRSEEIFVHDRKFEDTETFFKLEAKRLGNLGKKREREYVVGRLEKDKYINSGGIERFKKGIHANNLDSAGIIGYMQLHDFDHWITNVNNWITDLHKANSEFWTEKELLEEVERAENLSVYYSCHLREKITESDTIQLHHFWLNLKC